MPSTHDIAARLEQACPSESRDLALVSGFLIGIDVVVLEQCDLLVTLVVGGERTVLVICKDDLVDRGLHYALQQ